MECVHWRAGPSYQQSDVLAEQCLSGTERGGRVCDEERWTRRYRLVHMESTGLSGGLKESMMPSFLFDVARLGVRLGVFTVLLTMMMTSALAETIYLYPDADTFIYEKYPDSNYGSYEWLMVGESDEEYLLQSRVRFAGIPSGVTIESAYLGFYDVGASGSLTLCVQMASRSWQENTLTWNTEGSTYRWTTPNSTYSLTDSTFWFSVDVTSHVQQWADGTRSNYGFHLAWETALNAGDLHSLGSREDSQSRLPALAITYHTYGVRITDCTSDPNPAISNQNVTLSELTGEYHGASTGDLIKVTIGFRDDSGNWVGGDPVMVASGVPGLNWQPWSHPSGVTVTAPSTPDTYWIWVRLTPTTSDSTAIQDFKDAEPSDPNEIRDHYCCTLVVNPPPRYTLTLSVNPAGSVTANPAPGEDGKYDAGTVVTLTANPSSRYSFSSWSGDASGSTNPTQVTMNGNKSVTANFAINRYTVSLSSSPSSGGSTSGGGTYDSGSSVTVTASFNSGYAFVNWTESGSSVSTSASYTFTISGNRTLVANFTVNGTEDYHPADMNEDWAIDIDEVTAYGAAWKRGDTWPAPPNPIPIDYVTNAGMLWKFGETYYYESEEWPPQCWQASSFLKILLEAVFSANAQSDEKE